MVALKLEHRKSKGCAYGPPSEWQVLKSHLAMIIEKMQISEPLVREHGSIDLEWLRDVPPDEVKEYLLSVRGLGLKSVECVRLLTLHHLAFPLYAMRHFLFPPLNIEEYNDRVMVVVRCEDAMLQKLLNENCLIQEERDVLRWGKNIGSAKTRTKKRAGVAVYNRASSLETLVVFARNTDQIASITGFGWLSATKEVKMTSTVDDINAYSYLYHAELPSRKFVFKW
ncbi:Protein ROS1C [Camellia lanceoleosa]|uniref:Protein ROS1C n=1 Tax=Camellia lanceoleosa TaxID=1840588 RepID=A0ACC0FG56_9ERIC|nr:Protein ROS1C [Camellia lanceoleosa]